MNTNELPIKEHIRNLAADKNKQKLARDSGVSVRTIYRFIETGNISKEHLQSLSIALGLYDRPAPLPKGVHVFSEAAGVPVSDLELKLIQQIRERDFIGSMKTLLDIEQNSK